MKRLLLSLFLCLLFSQLAKSQSMDGCFSSVQLFKLYQSAPDEVVATMEAAKWLPIYDNREEKFVYSGDTLMYASKSWKYTMSYDDIFLKFFWSDSLPNLLQVQISKDCYQNLLSEIKAVQPCVVSSDDSLELTFWKSASCYIKFSEKQNNTSYYLVQYFNVLEMDAAVQRIQRQRQLAIELQRQRELKVQNTLRAADSLRTLEQYDLAISKLKSVQNLVPSYSSTVENKIAVLQIDIKNKKVKNYLKEGEELFTIKKYDESRKKYEEVLKLESTNETAQLNIEKIDRIKNVLQARKTTVYDYKTLNPSSYKSIIELLQDHLRDYVDQNSQGHLQFKMNLAYDTAGINRSAFVRYYNSDTLPSSMDDILKSSVLHPTQLEGIFVSSIKSRSFDIQWNSLVLTAKKINEKKINISPRTMPSSAQLITQAISKKEDFPTGRYIFSVKETQADSVYHSIALTEYKTVGGEAMFYSMLYPGVGTLAATHGKRGWTALTTFTVFMGGTITSLYYSKLLADRAMQAGEGSADYKKLNKQSNTLKWTHYICGSASAVIYVSDVFTALIKGIQNKKKSRQLRNSLKNHEIQFVDEKLIIQ